MKKVTVIIPVYNSDAYIEQCVQSLISQTYRNWEALLIDDGSTDRSLELCENLSRADSRLKVYHQENKGASAARNYGLDCAEGEYVAFLDSDDAIHPLLFEEMVRQIDEHHVEMVFCNFAQVDNLQMNEVLARASPQDEHPQWRIGDGEEAERWFHIDYAEALRGVSGMVSKNLIGSLRFDESLSFGEDTLFKYCLFRKKVCAAYSPNRWYYYRINRQSLCHRLDVIMGDDNLNRTVRIRDNEYQEGTTRYALIWETILSCQFRSTYELCKKSGSKDRCSQIKSSALQECGHPLFQSVDLLHKGLFYLCFKCYPLYVPVSWIANIMWKLKERKRKKDSL